MIVSSFDDDVIRHLVAFEHSRLPAMLDAGPYAIKFVATRWASQYQTRQPLKISDTALQTWGTATYVTPIAFPLSSALYGRIGLVTRFDPTGWKIFDATDPRGRAAYVNWARGQPAFSEVLLTVHSTSANQALRNKFRRAFGIDCVLFHPDQEAEIHTDRAQHVWMAVTDWAAGGQLDTTFSRRLADARFTVLLDEDFLLEENGLPIQRAVRRIEGVTEKFSSHAAIDVGQARTDPTLPYRIVSHYHSDSYLHVYIEP
jgi:hypothetical protein